MKKLVILSFLLLESVTVKAQADRDSINEIEEVVVTATRTNKTLKDVPIITRVVGSEEIKRTDATNLQDLLQQEIPGAEFSYTMGSQPSLSFQGFNGKDVLFLVDGERLAGETLDNVDFTRINMDDVEKIEIVKGASSSLYGSNAVGGVINIITKQPKTPWDITLNAKYGAHNEQRYGGTAAFKIGKFVSSTNIQRTLCDAINFKKESDYKAYAYDTWNIKEKLSYKFNRHFNLSGHAGYFLRNRDYSETQVNRFRDFTGGLKGNITFDYDNLLEISYLYDQYDKSDYYYDQYDILDYRNAQNTFRALYTHNFNDDLNLILGGDAVRDYLKTYQFADTCGKHQYTADIFTQVDWNITEKWNAVGGLRYDHFSVNDNNHATAKLGLMYKYNDYIRFRGSYAGGFRAPSLKETEQEFLMGGFMYIYGNKELKPETSNNFQLSAEYNKGIFDLSVSGFYNLFDNRISTRYDSLYYNGNPITDDFRSAHADKLVDCEKRDAYAIYENMEDLQVTGVNVDLNAKFDCGIKTSLAYVYTHESNTNSGSTRPHTAKLKLEYRHDWKNYGFNVGLSGRYLSKLEYSNSSTYDSYTIWKLSLMNYICQGITVNLSVDNLFNYVPDKYSVVSPSTTGTSFSASMSVNLYKLTHRNKNNKINN